MQGTVLALALRPVKSQALIVQDALELSPKTGDILILAQPVQPSKRAKLFHSAMANGGMAVIARIHKIGISNARKH